MIFGFSGTKRTVRNRELSVRRGYTVLTFHSLQRTSVALCIYYKNYLTLIMILLNYVPFNGMEIEIQKTKKILNMPMICILLELTQGACFLVIG